MFLLIVVMDQATNPAVTPGMSNYQQHALQALSNLDRILDSSYILHAISETLRGEVYDDNRELIAQGKPLVSEEGHTKIMMLLKITVNSATKLGILDIYKLEKLVGSVVKQIGWLIGVYGADLGVDQSMVDPMIQSFYSLIFTHMSSSLDGELIRNVTQNIQVISQSIEKEGNIAGWRGDKKR